MKYKLTYWNIRGRAEPIRIIFAAAKVEFEDHRILKEKWPQFKPHMPWNQVPVLQVGDKILAHSLTICRFLAQEFDLNGMNPWENAKCDEYSDAISDLIPEMKRIAHAPNEDIKLKFKSEFLLKALPNCLSKFEKILESKKQTHFLVGDKLTWSDIFVSTMLDRLELPNYAGPLLLEDYPYLKKLREDTYAQPGIKEWIETRPEE